MRYPDDDNGDRVIEYLIQDPVISLTDSVFIVSRESLRSLRPWIFAEFLNPFDDTSAK